MHSPTTTNTGFIRAKKTRKMPETVRVIINLIASAIKETSLQAEL